MTMHRARDNYMADHLDGLAEAIDGPTPPSDAEVKRAMLRGVAHVARQNEALREDVSKIERRVETLEKRDTVLDSLVRRVEALEKEIAEKRAEVRGGWWVACKVAFIVSSACGAGWAILNYLRPAR